VKIRKCALLLLVLFLINTSISPAGTVIAEAVVGTDDQTKEPEKVLELEETSSIEDTPVPPTDTSDESEEEESIEDEKTDESNTNDDVEESRSPSSRAASGTVGKVSWSLGDDGVMTFSGGAVSGNQWISGSSAKSATKLVFNGEVTNSDRYTSFFKEFTNVTSIEGISKFNVSNLYTIEGLFSGMTSLTSLDLKGWDTGNISNMSKLFSNLPNLESLSISGFNLSKVTNASDRADMFLNTPLVKLDMTGVKFPANSSSFFGNVGLGATLKELVLKDADTSAVTNMSSMFNGFSTTAVTNLDLSGWNTSKVTNMRDMIGSFPSLEELSISGWDMTNVGGTITNNVMSLHTIDMFVGATSLKKLDASNIKLPRYAPGLFYSGPSPWRNNIDGLSQVRGGSGITRGLKELNLSGLKFHSLGKNAANLNYMISLTGLISLDISNIDFSSLSGSVPDSMNTGAGQIIGDRNSVGIVLEKLNLSSSIFPQPAIKAKFYLFPGVNRSFLKEVNLTNVDTRMVTDMSEMFSGMSGLTSLDLSSFNTSNVTDMSSMFSGMSGLTSLDLSSFNTSNVTDMSSMFSGMSLEELSIQKFDFSKVTNASNRADMFSNTPLVKLDMTSVKFPVNSSYFFMNMSATFKELVLKDVDTSAVTIMSNMFSSLAGTEVSNLDLSSFNTSNVTNMISMFSGMSGLTSLDLSSFNTSNVTHGANIFSNVPLEEITLGEKSIFNWTNTGLKEVTPGFDSEGHYNTGGWNLVSENQENYFSSSADFMSNFNGSYPGTYVRTRGHLDFSASNFVIDRTTLDEQGMSSEKIFQAASATLSLVGHDVALAGNFVIKDAQTNFNKDTEPGVYTLTLGTSHDASLEKKVKVFVVDGDSATVQGDTVLYSKNFLLDAGERPTVDETKILELGHVKAYELSSGDELELAPLDVNKIKALQQSTILDTVNFELETTKTKVRRTMTVGINPDDSMINVTIPKEMFYNVTDESGKVKSNIYEIRNNSKEVAVKVGYSLNNTNGDFVSDNNVSFLSTIPGLNQRPDGTESIHLLFNVKRGNDVTQMALSDKGSNIEWSETLAKEAGDASDSNKVEVWLSGLFNGHVPTLEEINRKQESSLTLHFEVSHDN
jgi:surface protein